MYNGLLSDSFILLMQEDHPQAAKATSNDKCEKIRKSFVNGSLSDYLMARKQKFTPTPHEKELHKSRDLENLRLARKLSEIKERRSTFKFPEEGKSQRNIYQMKMATKKLLRELQEKHLQEQNNVMVTRILNVRNQKSTLSPFSYDYSQSPLKSQRRRKRSSHPIHLPQIGDTIIDYDS